MHAVALRHRRGQQIWLDPGLIGQKNAAVAGT